MTRQNYPDPAKYIQYRKTVKYLAVNFPDYVVSPDNNNHAFEEEAACIKALHNRINHRGHLTPRGKKDSTDYYWSMKRDQHRLQDIYNIRLRVYQFETSEVRARFSHLLSDPREI